jgi:adenylate kinase
LGSSRKTVFTNAVADIVGLTRPSRGYSLKKIQENNEAEIMQVVLEEAQSSYMPEIVIELPSETSQDLDSNVTRILEWITQWTKNQLEAD